MANKKLVLAKLTSPTLPRVIERKRLFRLLDGATKAPLTWIAAPPGAGKTTLLASYVKKRRRHVLWYRLDAGDADSSTFFHYLVLAVQAAAPRVRHPLPHLTPEYFAGLPIFTQRFFEALGEKVHRPTMLVFDNYHEVPMEALLHQLLPVGIQRLPPHIRVVVLSREAFPQGYIRMEAERQLRTIRPEELELTKAEARLLYDLQTKRSPLSTKTQKIGHFWELVRGWMAGFILLLEHGSDKEVNAGNSPQAIFDYLAAEVMNQCPPITRDILITMSLVPDFTPEMAVALTGRPEAGRILEQLHRNRYFIERRKDRVGWFRYHPLFRDFLQRRAQQALDAEALGRLRESAASFLISVNLEADAADLLEAAGAWDSYRALIKQYGPLLMQQGRVHTLEAWIRRLPESERAVDPWMDLWLAHCHLSLAPREATVLYESAFNKFRKRGEQEPMLLAWAGVVHSIIFSYSGMKRIHDWLQIFDEIHLPGSTFPSSEVEQLVTDALAVGYTYVAPDQPQARRWLNRTVALWDRGATPVGPFSKYFTEHCFIGFDDFTTLYAIFTKSKKNFERGGASPVERILHYLLTGALGWLQADVEECREAMKEGLALCESSGLLVFRVLLTSHGIYNELLIGNVGAARTLLEQIKPVSLSMGGLHLTHFLMLASWADLIEGRLDEAWQRCQQSTEILESEGSPMFQSALHYFMESQVLAARGNREMAQQTLARVETVGQAMPSMHLTTGVYFVRAQWAFEDGDEEQGAMWLRRLLEEGQTSPRIGFAGWVPQEAARLFAKSLELGIEVGYAREVIRKRQLKPPADGSAPENWPWRVKIRTFGKLTVEVDGKPLEKHRKAPHRLLELLAAIIAFGGQEVPVSRIGDALWPDADGDTAHENFKKSLARLRKLLTVDDVIQWQDGKISLNRELCWVDVLAFDKQAKQENIQAIIFYKGPFLGHGEIPAWADSWRGQVRGRFVRLVDRHCDQAQAAGKVEEAILSLKRAIETDPVAESLYQRLIPLLVAHGRQDDAQRYYETCRQANEQWGNTDLSPETVRLGQSLRVVS